MTLPNVTFPDVWGEGGLFAFSGMDGPTDAMADFVGNLGKRPGEVVFSRVGCELRWRLSGGESVSLALGDCFRMEARGGDRLAVFDQWHTMIGVYGQDNPPLLTAGGAEAKQADAETQYVEGKNATLVLKVKDGRFALSQGGGLPQATSRAAEGLRRNAAEILEARLKAYEALPRLRDDGRSRLLAKCFSVMRVNTHGPQGVFQRHWSTPDRLPHRWLWLWDSAFHATAMARFHTDLAWEFVEAVFDAQAPDGFVPFEVTPEKPVSDCITQSPILAWAVREIYARDPDMQRLRALLPRLAAYLEWDVKNRDRNQNGLPEWYTVKSDHCPCTESGLDNSPRFDTGKPFDAVDFACYLAHDMACLAHLYEAAGDAVAADLWKGKSAALEEKIHAMLWDDSQKGYRDRFFDGTFSDADAMSNLLPLLLESIPADRLEHLCVRMDDPRGYGSPMPLPSVALDDPRWSDDCWRGPTWLNVDWLVLRGLRKHGRETLARKLADRIVRVVERRYADGGVVYEYYDPRDEASPADLHRKGRRYPQYNLTGGPIPVIRDFHWTAAVTAMLLLDAG